MKKKSPFGQLSEPFAAFNITLITHVYLCDFPFIMQLKKGCAFT